MAASIAFVLLAVCATAAFRWCLGRVFDRAGARRAFSVAERARVIAFFHPYCNSAGGGERVLWLAIAALGQLHAKGLDLHVVVYTGDGEDDATILRTAADRFGVSFGTERRLPIDFVRLSRRRLLEAARYPRLTMIMQSLGSMVVAVEALCRATPDIFVDSTGFAFTLVIARLLARCTTVAYVHYPTISTDMLALVYDQRPQYNNDVRITSSKLRSTIKLLYYGAFAVLYGLAGSCAQVVMTNSTWTCNHIRRLWRLNAPGAIFVVFPPCDVESLKELPEGPRERVALSIGQFRPEKDHELQLRAFHELREMGDQFRDCRLVMAGGSRSPEDDARVEALRALASELKIGDHVDFVVNAKWCDLKRWFGRASVGLHTMWNEHFGIGVVEMMAAGVITVAHNSGGPASDIVRPCQGVETGFLAATPQEYARAMATVFDRETPFERARMVRAAREHVGRFADSVFMDDFCQRMRPILA